MCGLWNLDDFRAGSKYMVLDDLNIEFFPNWKPFLGCQRQFTMTDKFRTKRTVRNWLKPTIWLCNPGWSPMDSDKITTADKNWIEGNCILVDIGRTSLLD